MIDIHAHILPDVDDGPSNWDQSLDLCRLLRQEGVRKVVATPHVIPEGPVARLASFKRRIIDLTGELNQRLGSAGVELVVHPGSEVYMTPDIPRALDRDSLVTLGCSGKYLLVELPMNEVPSYAAQVLFEISVAGVIPVIAHPERNHRILRDPPVLTELTANGPLIQLNHGSLVGAYGAGPMKLSRTLLRDDMVHVVASDCHSTGKRSPRVVEGVKALRKYAGNQRTSSLCDTAPDRILMGKPLELTSPFIGGQTRPALGTTIRTMLNRVFRS